MKTKQLGLVLGISRQRNWWNRQSCRRTTEELATRNFKQRKRRSKCRHMSAQKAQDDMYVVQRGHRIVRRFTDARFVKLFLLGVRSELSEYAIVKDGIRVTAPDFVRSTT